MKELIEYVKNECLDAIGNSKPMSEANWGYEEGLLLTFNQGLELVGEIDRLNAVNEELLQALKESRAALAMMISPDCINQTTVISAFHACAAAESKARAAIEKAEK